MVRSVGSEVFIGELSDGEAKEEGSDNNAIKAI